MDRARAAGYIDNNFVQNQQRIRKRKDHLARIKKIMNRKPGTSVTLDNTPPIVQQATAEDPRKKAIKGLFSVIIERENKVLLQRISAIMTEPARNTVKEYDAMKKLIVPKNQGNARAYDAHMQKLRNDKFFASLRNQKPVYSVKAWEKDYEHQKYNQRFMREVSYKRPPGFVDPFAPAPSSSEPPRRGSNVPKQEAGGGVGSKDGLSSAHVNRVRNIKSERSSITKHSHSKGSKDSPTTNAHNHHKMRSVDPLASGRSSGEGSRERHRARAESGAEDAQFYEGDDFEEEGEDDFADEDEFKELLAEVHREIRVSEETMHNAQHRGHRNHGQHMVGGSAADELKLSVYLASAEVRCWLVNGDVIVLSAMLTGEEGRSLAAEAEISLEDLAVLRGEDPSLLGGIDGAGGSTTGSGGRDDPPQEGASSVFSHTFDLPMLQQIAQEMVAHVELRVDLDSGARLVLNLVSEDDALSDSAATLVDTDTDIFASGNDPRKHTGASGGSLPGAHAAGSDPANESLVSEEELGDMLIDDNRMALLAMGTKVPVHFENQVITASVANLGTLIDAAKIKSRNDFVYALIKVVNTEDDQLALTLSVMTNTVTLFKRFARPAVVKGTVLKISTALPSVIHADPELIYTFAQNMAANVRIVHSNRTGKNSLTIENVG